MMKKLNPELEQYRSYTLTELEPILGVTHHTLLMWIKNGKLQATRIGRGKWKVTKATLDQLLDDDSNKIVGQIFVNDSGNLQVDNVELQQGDPITVLIYNGLNNMTEWIPTTVEYSDDGTCLTGLWGYNLVGLFAKVKNIGL